MNAEMERYLKPTPAIDCDHPVLEQKARELTRGEEDIVQKAKSLFYFARDEIKYNMYTPIFRLEDFKASTTLGRGEGYCVQKAVLLAALSRAAGIPAALGFAKLRNNLLPQKTLNWLGTNILSFHGYTELYLNGKWVKATPAFDLELCQKNRIIPVEFDGASDAVFHSHNRDGKLHIEYLEDLGRRLDDLPLDRLWDALINTYGGGRLNPTGR